MTIAEIIKSVRWCMDEESNNNSDLAEVTDEKDDLYLDNIIKDKINDALRWACVTAPNTLLTGSSDVSLIKTLSFITGGEGYNRTWNTEYDIGEITLPASVNFIRFARIRGRDWHCAVITPKEEDDPELTMFDDTAKGTTDRPQAAIVRTNPVKILVQPTSVDFEVSVAAYPSVDSTDDDSAEVDIPENIKGAFKWYLTFLTLSTFGDSRASNAYEIAVQQAAVSQSSTTSD